MSLARVRLGLATLLLAVAGPAAAAASPRPAVSDSTNDSLLFIHEVIVGTIPCPGCPPRVCTSQPVHVTVRGGFGNACSVFRGLRVLSVAAPFPVLEADIVKEDCGGGCPDVVVPFS